MARPRPHPHHDAPRHVGAVSVVRGASVVSVRAFLLTVTVVLLAALAICLLGVLAGWSRVTVAVDDIVQPCDPRLDELQAWASLWERDCE